MQTLFNVCLGCLVALCVLVTGCERKTLSHTRASLQTPAKDKRPPTQTPQNPQVAKGAQAPQVAKAPKAAKAHRGQVKWSKPLTKPQPFALVELFTSEGCSSCPPADRYVTTLLRRAQRNKRPVYAMVYHVDYWNHLGWRDRFSQGVFTRLQKEYAYQFRNRGLYTPQMIVNGSWQFVGSRRVQGRQALARAFQRKASAAVSLCHRPLTKGQITLHYRYKSWPPSRGLRLNLALVEHALISRVTSGENTGRTLRNDGVVRWLKRVSLGAKNSGQVTLRWPRVVKKRNAGIIASIQHTGSLHIKGATQIALDTTHRCPSTHKP